MGGVQMLMRSNGIFNLLPLLVHRWGIETVQDCAELTAADFTALGAPPTFDFAQFTRSLERASGKEPLDRYGRRRESARARILASNASSTDLRLYLRAAGAVRYEPRLEALGARVPSDLRELRRSDLEELGMLELHMRRFAAAAALAPPPPPLPILTGTALNGGAAEEAALTQLLSSLGLARHASALASLGVASVAQLASLTHADAQRVGMRLIERRHLARGCRLLFAGSRAPAPAERAAEAPAALAAGTPPSANPLDGCRHVFLDVGANVGINLRHLYRGPDTPFHQFRFGPMQHLFDRHFGHTKATRVATVCSVAIEANPHHDDALLTLTRSYGERGIRTTLLTRTAASTADGHTSFNVQPGTAAKAFHEWGASVFDSPVVRGFDDVRGCDEPTPLGPRRGRRRRARCAHAARPQGSKVSVRTIDLEKYVRTIVLGRRIPPDDPPLPILSPVGADDDRTALPAVVMKMDIEGSEFAVLSRMLALGTLCRLDAAAVEFHDERKKGTRPIHAATGAPTNFAGLLAYVKNQSTPECKVDVSDLDTEAT